MESYGVTLVVVNTKANSSAEDELVADFVALVASFSGRIYGQRSAAAKAKLLAEVTRAQGANAGTADKENESAPELEAL